MDIKPTFMGQAHKIQPKQPQFEVTDNVLTVMENDEFSVDCVVEQSRPAAQIQLTIKTDDTNGLASVKSEGAASLISTTNNVVLNADRTFKTVTVARLKAHVDDHRKILACKAENGLANQKWENRRMLNILCEY
jgi:hypothetical protein